jgi:hypothetical protein
MATIELDGSLAEQLTALLVASKAVPGAGFETTEDVVRYAIDRLVRDYPPRVRFECRRTRDVKVPLSADDPEMSSGWSCVPVQPTIDEGWVVFDSSRDDKTDWVRAFPPKTELESRVRKGGMHLFTDANGSGE